MGIRILWFDQDSPLFDKALRRGRILPDYRISMRL
jgi:hypothetical protein